MDAFQGFDNMAGFFIGNEVLTTPAGGPAAPFVKAAAHDLKAYRNSKGYRQIPVGYSAADIASLRPMLQNYLACGPDPANAIDFFSLNAYEWCGDNSYQGSGYALLNSWASNYSIPIFFSETGCNTIEPRTFGDQAAIFGPDMSPYWSGSIIYEWIQEENNYGIVSYGPHVDPASPGAPPDGWPRSGTPNPVQPDFDNLKAQWASAKPSAIAMSAYTPSISNIPCPASTPTAWVVDPNTPLPTLLGAVAAPSSSAKPDSSAKSGNAPSTTITARVSLMTASIQTSAVAAVVAMGGRFKIPILLLSVVCWMSIGNVILL
jgi:1,3-beta-glucanosyltransferase GAS1